MVTPHHQSPNALQMVRTRFNRPMTVGREAAYVAQVIGSSQTCGDGPWSRKVQDWFLQNHGSRVLPTPSCSAALDLAAILTDIGPGDEFIVPSYTFVSSANAFVLRGARPRFADCEGGIPQVGLAQIQRAFTPRVKVVVVVHYAGVAHELPSIAKWCRDQGVLLVEDAAQAIGTPALKDPTGAAIPVGGWGDLAAFSFHETKNVACGEGGCLVVNRNDLWERAHIVWEKGTNRQAFFRGEVAKYGWEDVGSSFVPSELNMAYLMGQLECLPQITHQRMGLWREYHRNFTRRLPQEFIPPAHWGQTGNGHIFYVLARDAEHRSRMTQRLKHRDIAAHFHYQALHSSPFAQRMGWVADAPHAQRFSDTLLRLPLHLGLSTQQVRWVARQVATAWTVTA
jgi:dTDP-4-amino-4,6-dideoxygalactose transaminase